MNKYRRRRYIDLRKKEGEENKGGREGTPRARSQTAARQTGEARKKAIQEERKVKSPKAKHR